MAIAPHAALPRWAWLAPLFASLLLGAVQAGVVPPSHIVTVAGATVLLFGAVFAAVHHAEVLALRLGEPFGSILLAVSVTVIEVALIVSILLSGAVGSETVARDTVFAAVMIILNGIVGLCLILGGSRHHEQTFQLQGAAAALAVLGTLATLSMVLPNYTMATFGPVYSPVQLIFVGAVSLALYLLFVFVQTVRHREYFLDDPGTEVDEAHARPSARLSGASAGLLLVALVAVILLAKLLSYPLEGAVAASGLPRTFVGVVIAAIVLLPEGVASVRAALANRLQTSVNLALGSALATIGLTIPVVSGVALWLGVPLVLGITPEKTVLLVLTLFVATLTLGTGRTTVLQGGVHLVIFAVFLLLAAVP